MDIRTLGSIFNQNISFEGFDNKYAAHVVTRDVTVNCSPGIHNHGSSNVKLTNVVDYNWELRFCNGQILTVHVEGNVIAYGMKGKNGSMIRVANQKTNNRTLIKDIGAPVLDLSFALIPNQIVLGCVDVEGSLYIYDINDQEKSITWDLFLHIVHPKSVCSPSNNYRIIWCPYLPPYNEELDDGNDDPAKLFVFLNGIKAEIWDASIVKSKYGSGPLCPSEEIDGYMEINDHILDIIDASFSPDGTALATCSLDGYVKFFQVDMPENEKPRFLHEWKPHDGKALSCLFFLDNILHTYSPDSRFWKFAVTGSNCNTELKIWSCESWSCLQTICFVANPNSVSPQLYMKARLDMTGQYLLLSDINNRTLYTLKIQRNDSEQLALVSSISRFLLPAPFLSFSIVNSEKKKIKTTNSSEDLYQNDIEEFGDESMNIEAVIMKMFVVQPKQLQECTLTFYPENFIDENSTKTGLEDDLTRDKDKSEENSVLNDEVHKLQPSGNLIQQSNQTLNLMTPDAFNSPSQSTSPTKIQNFISETQPTKLNNSIEALNETNLLKNNQFGKSQKENFASGGSSPSREVQEIFSFTNEQKFFDELIDINKQEQANAHSHYKQDDESIFPDNLKKETVWSSIPILKATEVLKEENRRQELQDSQAMSSDQINADHEEDKIYLTYRIKALENLIQEQNKQLQKLSSEVKTLSKNCKIDSKDIRNTFQEELDLVLSRYQIQLAKLFENYINVKNAKDMDLHEKLVSTVKQVISKQITEKLQSIVMHETNTIVLPSVISSFENLKHQLSIEYSQKLKSLDHFMNENISNVITSKAVAESLSESVLQVIQPSLEQCYKNMIERALIPSWEKVCNSMFQQIHDTFTRGTKEYIASVETYMERQRRVQDKGKDLIIQMQAVSEAMKNNAEKLTSTLSIEIQKQLSSSFTSMQDKIAITIAELVSEQVKQGLKSHVAVLEDSVMNVVRSRAVTPSSHLTDTQVHLAQIQQLLAKGQIDIAFQQALSASDLSLVVYVCEKVDPQKVFGEEKCLLQQHVILSLIQQLSADLARDTKLKYRYLEEALLNLDPMHSLTKEHIPTILKELLRQLNNFISTNPTHKCLKNMRMLQMITQSLLKL